MFKQTNKQTIEGTENEAAMGRTELYCFFLFLIEVVSLFLDSNEKEAQLNARGLFMGLYL